MSSSYFSRIIERVASGLNMLKDNELVTAAECRNMIKAAVNAVKNNARPFKIFGLSATKEYAAKVAEHLDTELTPHTEKYFDDGESYVKSGPEYNDGTIGNVRGHNVFVIQSLYSDHNESVADKFMKLCTFCGSLKDASAHEVIPIIPTMILMRQDRKTESRAPVATKYVAQLIEAVGVSRLLTIDVHNLAAFQNAFRMPVDNLECKNLFADWCANRLIAENKFKKVKVLTPDSGGLGRCERFRNTLIKRFKQLGTIVNDIEIVIFDKLRINGEVRGGRIIGDVENCEVIAYDDMISTGGTMKKACKAVTDARGRVFAVCATHGLFCGKANDAFNDMDTNIVVADTVKPFRLNENNLKKLQVVDTTKMVADAILRIHSGTGSISELLRV